MSVFQQLLSKTKALGEHVGKDYGFKVTILVLQGKENTFASPALSDKPTNTEEMAWGKEYELYLKKKIRYEMDKAKVFAFIF
jgi:hypothetical protein